MRNINLILLFLITLISCAQHKDKKQCFEYYNNYQSLVNNQNKLALKELNKAIYCDSLNQEYRFEKVKLFILLKNYKLALFELEKLEKINSSYSDYFPLAGILNLKLGNQELGNKRLKIVYKNLNNKNFNSENFNFFYNKILLDFFFYGKNHALNEINKFLEKNNPKNVVFILDSLKKEIDSENNSIKLLYKVFNIEV